MNKPKYGWCRISWDKTRLKLPKRVSDFKFKLAEGMDAAATWKDLDSNVSMGASVKEQSCPACDEDKFRREILAIPYTPEEETNPFIEHEAVMEHVRKTIYGALDIPKRMIGVDFASGPSDHTAVAVCNANGDSFEIENVYHPVEVNAQHLDKKVLNSTAQKIKELAEQYRTERTWDTPVISRAVKQVAMGELLGKANQDIFKANYARVEEIILRDYLSQEGTREMPESRGYEEPHCPKCESSMVKRKTQRGMMRGLDFYGCTEYPNCSGTRTENEVKKYYPRPYRIKANAHEIKPGSFGLELSVHDVNHHNHLFFGRRITPKRFSGDLVFQDFIEPVARATNTTFRSVMSELFLALEIETPGVAASLAISEDKQCLTHDTVEVEQFVDTITLDEVMRRSKIIQRVLGSYEHDRSLRRFTFEITPGYFQIRAKNKKGITVCTGGLSESEFDDPESYEKLIKGVVKTTAQRCTMHMNDVLKVLREDLSVVNRVRSDVGKRIMNTAYSTALSISFRPERGTASGRFKCDEPNESNTPKPRRSALSHMRVGLTEDSVKLYAVSSRGQYTKGIELEKVRFDLRDEIKLFIELFVTRIQNSGIFSPTPSGLQILKITGLLRGSGKYGDKLADVAETMRREKIELRAQMKRITYPILPLGYSNVHAQSYSEATDKSIEERRVARPLEIMNRVYKGYEQEIEDRKFVGNLMVEPRACSCGKVGGCMCPRTDEPEVEYMCKHNILVKLNDAVAREVCGEEYELDEFVYACKDCLEVVREPVKEPDAEEDA